MRIPILAILLGCAACLPAALESTYPEHPGPERIQVITTDADEARSFLLLAAACSREADRLLRPAAAPEQPLVFQLGDISPEPLPAGVLFLDRRRPSAVLCATLLKALIMRRAREKHAAPLATLPAAHWLAAALSNRIFVDGKGIRSVYAPDFRMAHALYGQGHFPSLEQLLTRPADPEHLPFFRLYMLHADLLVRILENLSPAQPLIPRQLEMEAYGRPPLAALEFLLRQAGVDFQNIQHWYERAVLLESARHRQRNATEAVVAQLQELTTVTLLEAGSPDGIRRIPITEIPRIIDDYRLNARLLEQTQKKIQELRLNAPVLLQDPLALYLGALEQLKANNVRRFKKQFAAAEKNFAAAMRRQQQVEHLLDRIERERAPLLDNYDIFFDVIERYDRLFPCPGLPTPSPSSAPS